MKFGNKPQTSGRYANGEVSDYLLSQKGIVSLSPELGSSNI